jgi:hypothetical protein
MTQALSGAAVAALIALCWLLGRPKPRLLSSTDTSRVAALNRSQMELVLTATDGPTPEPAETGAHPWPRDARSRLQLLAELEHQFRAGGTQRQQAMAHCRAWGHRAALPLIRRGLKDPDTTVVGLAAEAMAAFRGRSTAAMQRPQAATLPRNVSRTR